MSITLKEWARHLVFSIVAAGYTACQHLKQLDTLHSVTERLNRTIDT